MLFSSFLEEKNTHFILLSLDITLYNEGNTLFVSSPGRLFFGQKSFVTNCALCWTGTTSCGTERRSGGVDKWARIRRIKASALNPLSLSLYLHLSELVCLAKVLGRSSNNTFRILSVGGQKRELEMGVWGQKHLFFPLKNVMVFGCDSPLHKVVWLVSEF